MPFQAGRQRRDIMEKNHEDKINERGKKYSIVSRKMSGYQLQTSLKEKQN
jgi:hypothetical protein